MKRSQSLRFSSFDSSRILLKSMKRNCLKKVISETNVKKPRQDVRLNSFVKFGVLYFKFAHKRLDYTIPYSHLRYLNNENKYKDLRSWVKELRKF